MIKRLVKCLRRMLRSEWTVIAADEVKGVVAGRSKVFVLFTINDCPVCAFAKNRLNLRKIRRLGVEPLLVIFRELNPGDMRQMDELLVYFTPQGRLYVNGRIVSAWESIDKGATADDLNSFNLRWLRESLRNQ